MSQSPGTLSCGIASLLAVLLLSGCAATPPARCAANQKSAMQELIYFGAEKPGGQVSPAEWTSFLEEIVTPRFPSGFTTWDAAGQWRAADGSLTREASHVLNLVHDGDPASVSSVIDIIDRYKVRFSQEAVLRVNTPACISF
jgi:hypothetical protein